MISQIIDRFFKSRNIREKRNLTPILDEIYQSGFKHDQIYASLGEDAAALRVSTDPDMLILLTTDALLPEFINASPYGAGFAAIYVGFEDITACGGTPIACSTIVGYSIPKMGKEIFRGILDATHRFRIPLIRGHTITDSPSPLLSSTVIGQTTRDLFASVRQVQPNQFLSIVWDPDGEPANANRLYWNSITMKNTDQIFAKRSFIRPALQKKLISTCKDISNGGILGTLYQLLQLNPVGAEVWIDKLESALKRDKCIYTVQDFLFVFLTSGFLITGPQTAQTSLRALVEQCGMKYYEIGIILPDRKYRLKYNSEFGEISPLEKVALVKD